MSLDTSHSEIQVSKSEVAHSPSSGLAEDTVSFLKEMVAGMNLAAIGQQIANGAQEAIVAAGQGLKNVAEVALNAPQQAVVGSGQSQGTGRGPIG